MDPFSKDYLVYHTWYMQQAGFSRQERDYALTHIIAIKQKRQDSHATEAREKSGADT